MSFGITEVYKIDERSENIEVNHYGRWHIDQDMAILEKKIWKRRSDLKGSKIG